METIIIAVISVYLAVGLAIVTFCWNEFPADHIVVKMIVAVGMWFGWPYGLLKAWRGR